MVVPRNDDNECLFLLMFWSRPQKHEMMTRVASSAYATPLLVEEYSRRLSYIMLRYAFDTFDLVS